MAESFEERIERERAEREAARKEREQAGNASLFQLKASKKNWQVQRAKEEQLQEEKRTRILRPHDAALRA